MKSYPAPFSDIWILAALLLVSLLIRLFLILGSGELVHYDGPEYFGFSRQIHAQLAELDLRGVFTTPVFAHWGCILFGAIPFFIKTSWLSPQETSAIFFALPSVLNIFLVYKIALAFCLPHRTALISAFLYAFSFVGIYQVRHVLPHDLALSFFLAGIILTLSTCAKNRLSLFLAGLCYFLCFFTYYGYWTLAFIGLLFASLHHTNTVKIFFLKGFASSAGFILPLFLFFVVGYHYDINYLKHFVGFSQTITMGLFDEGYSLPFFFLYHTEGLLFFCWMVCLAMAFTRLDQYAVKCSLIGILLIYGLLVAGSNIFQYFVVYGRLVKAMIPMLCLISACVLSGLDKRLLAVLFFLFMPGLIFNSWQIHKTTFWADISKAYQQETKHKTAEGRERVLAAICKPWLDQCGPRAVEGCHVLQSFPMPENLKFFQYDAVDPEKRKLANHYKLYFEIRDCPKKL